MKLGTVLINRKTLTREQVQIVLSEQIHSGKKLGELLIEKNWIRLDELKWALQEQYWRNNSYWVID